MHSACRTTGNEEPESLSLGATKVIVLCGNGKQFAIFYHAAIFVFYFVFKSITHAFECKKDNFPSVRRKYKKERPKPLFM